MTPLPSSPCCVPLPSPSGRALGAQVSYVATLVALVQHRSPSCRAHVPRSPRSPTEGPFIDSGQGRAPWSHPIEWGPRRTVAALPEESVFAKCPSFLSRLRTPMYSRGGGWWSMTPHNILHIHSLWGFIFPCQCPHWFKPGQRESHSHTLLHATQMRIFWYILRKL